MRNTSDITDQRALLAEVHRRIRATAPEAADVLLFGSRARGDARADSDIDLIVVVPDSSRPRDVSVRIRLALWGVGAGFDIVCLTESEMAQLRASDAWHHRQMLREARPLHEAA